MVRADSGKSVLLVLRRGVLRIFPGTQPREKHHGLPLEVIQLLHKSDVVSDAGGALRIRSRIPYEAEHVFEASSEAEGALWLKALTSSRSAGIERLAAHLQFLAQGTTAYKYNYSNSKRMRRHFWVEASAAELRWGKTRTDESPQSMDLTSCVGIIYGPMTSTFQRCSALEDAPWCCFSLLFPDRTLDLAVAGDAVAQWFLGLQQLLLERSPGCVTCLSEAQFVFRRVQHKLRHAAHGQGLTVRAFLVRQLRALAEDPGAIVRPAGEQKAKGERRKSVVKRASRAPEDCVAVGHAATEPRPTAKPKDGMSFAPPPRGDAAPAPLQTEVEAEQAELKRMAAELEQQVEEASAKLEAIRPRWDREGLPPMMSMLQETLRMDGVGWQADKCSELEREVVALQLSNNTAQRQVQDAERVEKQLKRLAKQYKETDAQVQAMEQELGAAKAGAQSEEGAKHSSTAALERAQVQNMHLERRAKELEQQLAEATRGGADPALLVEQNRKQAAQLEHLQGEKAALRQKLQAIIEEIGLLQRRRQENERKLKASQGLSQNLVAMLRDLQGVVGGLRAEQTEVASLARDDLRRLADDFMPLTSAVQKVSVSRGNFEQRYRELAEERKKLHNMVLELKGNIRVFVRVRPMSEKEKAGEVAGENTITFAEDCKLSVFEANTARRKWFEFDKAFQPKCAQQEVFEEVKPLATSVLDGFNVCIFAYGQTGSGKTFTMTGNKENPGLNVRVLTELFRIREARKLDTDISISLMISEIYNECIKDLFVTKQKKLDVKQNPDGSNTVPGLTEIAVDSVDAVLSAMSEASGNRTVMATDMNEESSRSHSIVQVKTVCTSKKDKREYIGKINLIDLAGSENVNKSGVTGQGMKEAQNINKSLSALGDVIQALVAKTPHIPYRNSKLTMMLKDSLGGDCKTLMIVQCSPAQANCVETLSSLNFAARARNVELGKAKRNVKGGD